MKMKSIAYSTKMPKLLLFMLLVSYTSCTSGALQMHTDGDEEASSISLPDCEERERFDEKKKHFDEQEKALIEELKRCVSNHEHGEATSGDKKLRDDTKEERLISLLDREEEELFIKELKKHASKKFSDIYDISYVIYVSPVYEEMRENGGGDLRTLAPHYCKKNQHTEGIPGDANIIVICSDRAKGNPSVTKQLPDVITFLTTNGGYKSFVRKRTKEEAAAAVAKSLRSIAEQQERARERVKASLLEVYKRTKAPGDREKSAALLWSSECVTHAVAGVKYISTKSPDGKSIEPVVTALQKLLDGTYQIRRDYTRGVEEPSCRISYMAGPHLGPIIDILKVLAAAHHILDDSKAPEALKNQLRTVDTKAVRERLVDLFSSWHQDEENPNLAVRKIEQLLKDLEVVSGTEDQFKKVITLVTIALKRDKPLFEAAARAGETLYSPPLKSSKENPSIFAINK